MTEFAQGEKLGKRHKDGPSSADGGVYVETLKQVMQHLGFKFVATMGIGTGCKVHMREDELPKGRLVVRVSKHYAAVIDGVLHDNHDSSRKGKRCVYGYFVKA